MDFRDVLSRSTSPTDGPAGSRPPGPAPTSRNASATFHGASDGISPCGRAPTGQQVWPALLGAPGVRADRVDAVRSKLADGTLSVDAARIARALLEQEVVRL